jgi:hypothetical protein
MSWLILKRAPIGWNQGHYDVVENGVIVGRIFQGADRAVGSALDVRAATTAKYVSRLNATNNARGPWPPSTRAGRGQCHW